MIRIAHGWELAIERGPNWLFVRPLDRPPGGAESLPLADEVWHLLQQHFTRRLVLELDRVGYLDSNLIGQLARLYKRISADGGLMRLCGLSAANQSLLEQCRLSGRFACYPNRADAVMGHRPLQPR